MSSLRLRTLGSLTGHLAILRMCHRIGRMEAQTLFSVWRSRLLVVLSRCGDGLQLTKLGAFREVVSSIYTALRPTVSWIQGESRKSNLARMTINL